MFLQPTYIDLVIIYGSILSNFSFQQLKHSSLEEILSQVSILNFMCIKKYHLKLLACKCSNNNYQRS